MATIVLTLPSICAGGDHAVVGAKVGNGPVNEYAVGVDEVFSEWTDEERRQAAYLLVKLYAIGKTRGQVRANLTASVTVTI